VKKILIKARAAKELNLAYEYYDSINSSLADRFEDEIWRYLDTIESHEELFQVRYRTVRIAPLTKFPYSIHYYVEKDQIVVLGIKHQRQFYK